MTTFGLKTEQSRASYADLVRIWQEADDIPAFADAWLYDHFVPLRLDPGDPCIEGWTALAGLAMLTRRIRLGLMVASNTYRHPAVFANMAATLDVMSNGRVEFGIGAGWHEGEHAMYGIKLGTPAERIRALDEACEVVRRLWTIDVADFAGKTYNLVGARCEPKPVQAPHPPITIGGTGERMTLRVVARHAARWNFNGKSVEQFVHLNGVLDAHCAAVGRDPTTIVRSVQRHLTDDFPAAVEEIAAYIEAGAHHIVLNPRIPLAPGIATRLLREVIEPIAKAI